MHIKIKTSELYKLQKDAPSIMKWIEVNYNALLQPAINDSSPLKLFWKRLTTYPPSLRMYNIGEALTKDDEVLRKAKIYRKAWHDNWCVINTFNQVSKEDGEIWLDSYETEVIMSLRKNKKLIQEF